MLPTKTLIPQQRRNVLHRPRLVDRMHRNIDKTLTLVSAPAGYGKTSLLVDFCHDDPPFPVCWLSLDNEDCDVCTFASHLVSALQHRFPDFGGPTLRTLHANPDAGRNPVALGNVIVQDMEENIPEFFVLALDDYHVVDRAIPVSELLQVLLKRSQQRWHVIVASRTVPGYLPLILLTARDQIAYVGQNDLAFSADEARRALKKTHDLTLTLEQARELVAVSEGWITGILLATASRWSNLRNALARAKAQQEPIYTYLADQVFAEQPQALRDTMLTMSTLEEMNETLCQQTLGLRGAGGVLQELERRGLFLTTVVADDGDWYYRYHHLFRDFLQARLRQQNLERFCRLHKLAAQWFEACEQWAQAVAHHLASGDVRAAAQTMENGARPVYMSGRLETVVAWCENMPESLRSEFPRLLLHAARALFDLGRADEAIPLLHQAEATFAERGETEQVLFSLSQRATIRCAQGRYAETLDLAREALESATLPLIIAEAHRLIGLACLNLGQPKQAVEHLRTALDLHQGLGTTETAVTYLDLSFAHLRLGQLSEGWACQDKAIELYRAANSPPGWRLAMTLNDIACGRYYLAGDYVQAMAFLREALSVAQAAGSPRAQAFALLSTADLYRDLGAPKESLELYAQVEKIARQANHAALVNFVLVGAGQARLQLGNVVDALGLAAQARDQAQRRGDVYQLGLSCLALGAAHLEAGDYQTALAEIERGRNHLEQSGARRDLTHAHILLARARQAAGDVQGTLESLGQALDTGIETHTLHYLIIEGQRVFDLFKQMLQQNPTDRRVAQIMDRIRTLPDIAREVLGELTPAASPQQPTLRFYGFGPAFVEKDNQPIAWRSVLASRLTFYLLIYSPRSRAQIRETFWPHISPDKAASSFHWNKYQIKRELGRAFITYEDSLYRIEWDPDCWFDVKVFETLLDGQEKQGRQARLEQAVALYRGDFMEGYEAEWCWPVRERLQTRYRDALVDLGKYYTEQSRFADGLAVLNQALEIDDLHEPAIQTLMRLYALDGRSDAALNLFQRLKRRLLELQALPSPKSQQLYRSIQAGDIPGPG